MSDECTQAQLPKNDPRMLAWGRFQRTEDYVNTLDWAAEPEHRVGSMWRCFLEGYTAGSSSSHVQAKSERIEELATLCEQKDRRLQEAADIIRRLLPSERLMAFAATCAEILGSEEAVQIRKARSFLASETPFNC